MNPTNQPTNAKYLVDISTLFTASSHYHVQTVPFTPLTLYFDMPLSLVFRQPGPSSFVVDLLKQSKDVDFLK